MEMTQEDFDERFQQMLDAVVERMADNAEIDLEKFYTMTCILENLSVFSPVFYSMIKKQDKL